MSILTPALRRHQWVYNNGEALVVEVYDKELVDTAVADLQRQLADVTRERDTLQAMLDLQNAKLDRVAELTQHNKPLYKPRNDK